MSDDLEERVACMQVRLYKYDIGEKLAKELIAMFKQDAVEAIEDKLRFGSTNCCQNLLKTLKEL